jgi:tetratricopeptide (TPR) repeat protein
MDEDKISELLKLATVQARDKDYDAAIHSLELAYDLMETVGTEWPIKTYFRLPRYLHLSGQFDEAITWLQEFLENLDSRCDAREELYREWGWMQKGKKPATIPKSARSKLRRSVREEIAVFKEREKKIRERNRKKASAKSKRSAKT